MAAYRSELDRRLAEAEVAASVAHPNVVRVYDYGESGGRPYMALEFVPGGTVGRKPKAGGRLPPGEAADLVDQPTTSPTAVPTAGVGRSGGDTRTTYGPVATPSMMLTRRTP